MSVGVKVRNKNIDGALIAFKNKVKKAGILEEYKENQYYTKPSEKRRLARKEWRKKKSNSQ